MTKKLTGVTPSEASWEHSVVRLLAKFTKKGRGGVDMRTVREALKLMSGWTIEDTCVAFEAWRSYDARDILRKQIPGCQFVHRDNAVVRDRWAELKTLHVGFKIQDPTPGRAFIESNFTIVKDAPSEVAVGGVYITEFGNIERANETSFPGMPLGLVWIGVAGWIVTAPDGATATILTPVTHKPEAPPVFQNLASLWTFVYNHGIDRDAQQTLDAMGSDVLEKAAATKAERERIEETRLHLPEIAKLFRDITEQRFEKVVEYLTAKYIKDVTGFVAAENDPAQKNTLPAPHHSLWTVDPTTRTFLLTPDHREKAAMLARDDATVAREKFVHKNTTRISVIARRKGKVPTAKVLHEKRAGVGGYGGEIRFTFSDGSAVTVRNKTVWKESPLGTYFAQFPTTFHDVIMPDGSRMPSPCEARMQDVFAAA